VTDVFYLRDRREGQLDTDQQSELKLAVTAALEALSH